MCKIISVIFNNQAIQHNKLNSAERPCQTSPDYNFAHCVHKHIIQRAGCQPHWRLVSLEGIPKCQNLSMLQKYSNIFWNISYNMDADDVFQATNCLRPCTYMEYKVSVKIVHIPKTYRLIPKFITVGRRPLDYSVIK